MLIAEVLQCMFSKWYPILGNLSVESEIIPVNKEFCDYLLSDGIILPKCCDAENGDRRAEEEENNEDNTLATPEFPQIEAKIRQCLRRFNCIFPKMNWSSCEDSQWIQSSGTKCSNLSEVFLLLNSSDKIVHDLTEPFEHCSDFDSNPSPAVQYELIIRKWININPSMEFRCFVAKNSIIGISQRDVRSYYEHLRKDKQEIIDDICNFFHQNIAHRFPLDKYVIDLYRPAPSSLILIDVNPFGELTDSLLFDWNELRSKVNSPPPAQFRDFRFIEDRRGIQVQRFEHNSLPVDVFNGNISLNL